MRRVRDPWGRGRREEQARKDETAETLMGDLGLVSVLSAPCASHRRTKELETMIATKLCVKLLERGQCGPC